MKLSEHVDQLREHIEGAFDKQFARLGLGRSKQLDMERLPEEIRPKRLRFEEILNSHIGETGDYQHAREKLIDELTFTLFNRLAAVKVMEAADLFPPVLTKQTEHGDRSFGHKAWLEINPHMRSEELEGIREYIIHAFDELGETLPLYSRAYPYALLPDTISLNEIIDAFNAVKKDPQVRSDIWQSDDVLGWLYESYNNQKKKAHKDSKAKTEYDKVSLQSQVYTPRWVVQFLVENSLGKLYLEMYPDSEIKRRYKIANAPKTRERKPKPLPEIKMIDPACGSGNFILYGFDFFYALYMDQIENYGADYDEKAIPKLIIENNLHGIDLDDRAVQLAQLGLYIKARKKRRNIGELAFNVVSSDFFLPDYEEVQEIFESEEQPLSDEQKDLVEKIWGDLQQAYRFGSLVRVGEKVAARLENLMQRFRRSQIDMFAAKDIADFEIFRENFFLALQKAVAMHAQDTGEPFLSNKTRDAITFLRLLTLKYDVATANPPYTDSGDFGPELKSFLEDNYKEPYKFHTNLYATFIKRCYELVSATGLVAMVHPPTFMYIKKFESVRKFMIDKTHIGLFVEWGYLGMFNPSARVDSALYILEKNPDQEKNAVFIKLNHLSEIQRYDALLEAYEKFLEGEAHNLLYKISQYKLKIIKSWPFIYWISDEFREKFKGDTFEGSQEVSLGLKTGKNEKFLRFHWEVIEPKSLKSISTDNNWYLYQKGGDYNKWFGNNWLVVNKNTTKNISIKKLKMQKSLGITAGRQSTKGASFRYKNATTFVDDGTMNVFLLNDEQVFLYIGLLNSKLSAYLLSCFNPTVNKQAGDLKRIPLAFKGGSNEALISKLSYSCVSLKKYKTQFFLNEANFNISPIFLWSKIYLIKDKIKHFLSKENHLSSQIIVSEAIINAAVFDVYNLNDNDKNMILSQEGLNIGGLPVSPEARNAYLAETEGNQEFPLDDIRDFIKSLPTKEFSVNERESIENGFSSLYQSNNDLEEFCIRHQVNPINVWYWFKQSKVIPQQRMHTLAMEFLVDMVREILIEDEDGIIPLVPNAGEKILLDRIEEKFYEKGFSSAQYSSFDSVLGRPIQEYLNKYFFAELSDHLNVFPNLPKTPFIWHLSSGPEQGFDCYIIIYKWSRDNLLRLRSVYIEHRERALVNRQSDLAGNDSAEAQNEKDRIFRQLKEIESFKQKIDELLAEGYDPVLDDGVGKNIAPLQKKKMIPYEVLNKGQLKKYLNADW